MACADALRGYSVSQATCAESKLDVCSPKGPPPHAATLTSRAIASCRRNIYLDLGANWCNTLTLFESVPEVTLGLAHKGMPWHVYAVEAAPLISPYVERCCAALSVGRPLPTPPVPPAGSSMQLLHYAKDLKCDVAGWSRGGKLRCIARALEAPLEALARSADPALTSNPQLLRSRLESARTRGCGSGGDGGDRPGGNTLGNTFSLLPAAAGASEGVLRMAGSPLQMLRGGSMAAGGNHMPQFDVAKVDVVSWLRSSFSEEDFVILKMDVEGAEREIMPALLATNATRLVDVVLWECHLKWRGAKGKCQCAAWEVELRARGVRSVYREPYRFAGVEKARAARWVPPRAATNSSGA